MCGIVGIVSLNGNSVDSTVLQRMNDLQEHRGPDGEGFLLSRAESERFQHAFIRHTRLRDSDSGVRVGLGHRRLAILDLSDLGLQPMTSRDRSCWIVFNGEIYNFPALRLELQSQGYDFTTRTDTEVLLNAYLHWGEDCLSHLEGMYAFAIWDSSQGRLFCARDRLGIKPFYYATPNGHFIFASEIKSLLAFPGLEATPDDDAVLAFLVHGNCDYGESTILKNVKALPAAHSLTLDMNTHRISLRRYWQLEPQSNGGTPDDDRIAELKELLLATVRKHLNSDVRAGSCLSGGLDSSTVVSLTGKIWREQPEAATAIGDNFHTFTSCYEYPELDERDYALAVANSVGATSQLVFPSPSEFWSDFEHMAWHEDMPFNGLSFYAQWCVMRAAKEAGVKVLLDGQGGDEVFGGYAKFRYAYLASLLRSGSMAKMVRELGATVGQGDRYVLDIRNGYRYLPKRVRSLLKVDSLLKEVLKAQWDRVVSAESTPATRWWRNTSGTRNGDCPWTIMQRIQVDDILLDTLPTLLRLEDRSSMAFSLEARVPLLDHKLVEYGVSLPDDLKVHNGWSKYAVRQAMRELLPESVRLRKSKLGFAAPDHAWPSQELRCQVTELIQDDLRCRKYVDQAALRRWYKSGRATTANTESYLGLFRILSLEMWMRAFNFP
jgi:asparagine synthase (glutamine-hydrolysing)